MTIEELFVQQVTANLPSDFFQNIIERVNMDKVAAALTAELVKQIKDYDWLDLIDDTKLRDIIAIKLAAALK